MRNYRLQSLHKWVFARLGYCAVDWQLFTVVSGQPIGSTFKGQAAHKVFFFDCLTVQDGTDK